jgi:hypothetical protein
LLALVFAALLLTPNRAVADDDDPPSRVARLSYSKGEVSFSPSGTDDWVSAALNRPLTIGDKLWTDRNARAELQVGSAVLYLSGETGFSFLNLDDHIMQVRLTEGTLNLRVRRLSDEESIEVDTPNLAFSVLRAGSYRINVNEAGDTTVINVREGQGEVTGGGSAYSVHPNEQGYFTGTDSINADIQPLPDQDEFDQWCNERELRAEHAPARRYVSDDVIGYEDLDEYGGWRPEPEYGTVWFPHTTVVDWAPYRYGHWVWISPWGWTWVDDEPWGFAPFHYGRWIFVRGAWGWVPCPPRAAAVAYVRPVYAPALVAWVGGPHFGVGVAVGGGVGANVGWFPLGPREVFVPSYHVSRTYVNNVNISNTTVNQTVINNYYNTTVVNKNVNVNNTNVTNVRYVNQSVPGAVTATSGQTFTSARPVHSNLVAVNQREIATAPVAVTAPAVAPPKQAVLGAGAVSNVRPPAALQTRPVVAKTAPPPAPLPFAQRQAAIQANQGRPISIAESRQLEMQHAQTNARVAPVRIAPAATAVTPRVNNNVPNNAPNNANRPAQVQNNNNRPPAVNTQQQQNVQPGNVQQVNPNNRPANTPPNVQQANPNNNKPVNAPPNTPANTRANQDRPPNARNVTPAQPTVNPQLEQKHQMQNQQLQQKQDQERQQLEQKQFTQQQKIQQQMEQQKADQAKQQQVQQKQQQQLEQMEQKHNQQQQQLQQKQQVEHAKQATKPQPQQQQSKPPKTEDKPPHR